jgi:PAS domain S-box-containing protein
METERTEQREKTAASAVQINDLFDSVELARAIETREFKEFLDHVPIAMVVSKYIRAEHRIVYANRAFELKTGRALTEIKGRGWAILDVFRHEDDPQITIGQALLGREDYLGTFGVEKAEPLLVEVYAGIIENEDGSENYRIAVLIDVTARDRAQREEFLRQIREKELLLKEIEHRVKNNLQLIAVLIRLEARSQRNGSQVNLEQLAGRVEALQLLYQDLSAKPGTESVDLGHYLGRIASGVMRSHGVEGIQLDSKISSVPVSINVAMPVGLIINELLTNAFKYAFVGRDKGTITLECLQAGDNRYRITIADNGVGLPPGVTWPTEGKLSALIVQTLRENIWTDLVVQSAPGIGTKVVVTLFQAAKRRVA